jgi:hypothetical protein
VLDASDLAADHGLLTATSTRDHESEVESREAQVVAWTHSRGSAPSPYRAALLRRERGTSSAELLDGRPDDLTDVTVYGLDTLGRVAIERTYGPTGAPSLDTVARYEATYRTFATYGWAGAWTIRDVSLERWDHGRPCSVASLRAAEPRTLVREDYIYDGERVVEIVEVRAAVGTADREQRTWSVECGDDGRPDALVQDGAVVWQRVTGEARPSKAR